MEQDLVINIGNTTLAGAFFEKGLLIDTFTIPSQPLSPQKLREHLENRSIQHALIGADNAVAEKTAKSVLTKASIPFFLVENDKLSLTLDVEKPDEVGKDRIANCYGALAAHPNEDLIVIDMGTAITFDVITKDRRFLGGAIAPGAQVSVRALADYTDKLPLVPLEKPKSSLSRTTTGNIQSGIYYGLIGLIEKMLAEIKSVRFSGSKVTVIATGGLASGEGDFHIDLEKDLQEQIDYFEPDLTFSGLYQIYLERIAK